MKISREGLALIKKWEGCRLKSYKDGGGVWTIGYGTTTAAGMGVIKAGMTITQEQADEWLLISLGKYEKTVQDSLTRNPTQSQYDAMVSLCYNIGQGAFAKSTLVRRFNAGDIMGAADAFLMWVNDNGQRVQGLVNRRKEERSLFLKASVSAPPPDVPKPETPPVAPETVKKPLSIGTVMAWIVGAIIAAIGAYLGFGR